MTVEQLKERLQKAEEKIVKKENTIEKKKAQIAKKENAIRALGGSPDMDRYEGQKIHEDIYWLVCDIDGLKGDIRRGEREIEETKATIEKYKKSIADENAKEDLLSDIPESLRSMQDTLVESWDKYDLARLEEIMEAKRSMTFKEFMKKYTYADWQYTHRSKEDIHKVDTPHS